MSMPWKKWLPYIIVGLASLFYVYDYFIQVSPAVITDQLMSSFHIGAAGLGLLGSMFFYAYAGMQVPAGILLDKFGARRLISVAILVSGIGVLIFGLTHSFVMAEVSRIFVGFGSAFSFIGALFLAAHWFEHKRFAMIAGLIQFAGCLGSIFGEAPLADATNHFGWRLTMIVIAIITFVVGLLFWLIIRDDPKELFSTHKAKPVSTKSHRLKLLEVMKNPQVHWIALSGLLCWIPVASLGALWGVPYLMKIYHWSNTEAAGFCSIFWLSLGLGSPFMGWLSDFIQIRKIPFYICFSAGIIGGVLLMLAPYLSVYVVALSLLLIGLGPAIQSLTFSVAKDDLADDIFGTASGYLNMMAIVGGGITQVIMGIWLSALWDGRMSHGIPVYSLEHYQMVMMILPISAIIGLWISFQFIKETHCKPQSEE